MAPKVLEVKDLATQFKTRDGIVHAVNGVSFELQEGETLGIVGESACGKTVTVLSILGLIPSPPGKVVSGSAHYLGKDLLTMSDEEIRFIRGAQISMVFQDPMTSFNPVLTIGRQVAEPIEKLLFSSVTVFRPPSDPFTSTTVAGTLLDELGASRLRTPSQNAAGLSHLMTGRDLDGTTVGIAYIGALCSPQYGVSLSQTPGLSATTAALVIAHEIGHNFGADHDGEAGSACETTPQTFLMAPRLVGSDQFSQCSLDIINTHIQRITEIVRQMSTFARTDSIYIKLHQVNDILTSSLDLMRLDKRMKSTIEMRVNLDATVPRTN